MMGKTYLNLFCVILIGLVRFSTGRIVLAENSIFLIKDRNAVLTCEVDPVADSVTWRTDRFQSAGVDKTQSTCLPGGNCIPAQSVDTSRYTFSSSVNVGAAGQYNMTIATVDCLDSATYACVHSAELASKHLPVKVLIGSITMAESGSEVTVTTDCTSTTSDIQTEWIKVYPNSTEEVYIINSLKENDDNLGCPSDGCGTSKVSRSYSHTDLSSDCTVSVKLKVKVWHTADPSIVFQETTKKGYLFPEPCCKPVVCWVLAIVAIVLIILLVVIHICLIECKVPELAITDLNFSLFGFRALLPGCCVCVLGLIIHIIVYFVQLADDCDTVKCLVLPLIVKVLSAAVGLVIIAIYVYVRGKKGRPGNEKDDSEGPTCFGGNNSILPICGDSGSKPQRSTHGVTLATKTTHPPDNSSKFRPQPPLPGIKSEKTTGNPSPIPESGNKTRLDPIGQETQPRYEDASDSQSGEKKKKKKKKRRSKEGEEGGANIEGISE